MVRKIDDENIKIEHFCKTNDGCSGCPLLNLDTYKVIGIHLGKYEKKLSNVGIILKWPIIEFNKLNEILLTIEIDENEINI